ncbi:isochorismatase family protein, partial [bacterium]|nr:isochorismatase family protein [bacterium]
AFFETPLEALLNEKQVTQLVICGVMTHLCCETTARSAFVRGFQVILPVDATATYTKELHRATLLTLSHGFAIPLLTKNLVKLVERER